MDDLAVICLALTFFRLSVLHVNDASLHWNTEENMFSGH